MKKLFLILALLAPLAHATTTLTTTASAYTVDNGYYQAVIPLSGQTSAGLVKHLYIYKSGGTLSADLVYQGAPGTYGLGWLEGCADATSNDVSGIGSSLSTSVSVVTNTSSTIVIKATLSIYGCSWSNLWTFTDGNPYFALDSSVTRTDGGNAVNQFQFANMVQTTSENTYGTDGSGNAVQITRRTTQPINSPGLASTYPWANYEYTVETVSLGYIFEDVNHKLATQAEFGDWPFEHQLNWSFGGGPVGSQSPAGNARTLHTVYYTANSASHTGIAAYAASVFASAPTSTVNDPPYPGAFYLNNPYNQNSGYGSVIGNSPYWQIRQNMQNVTGTSEYPQYTTYFYGPLWTFMQQIGNNEDYNANVSFSLNYDNDSTSFPYGTVTPSNAINSSTVSVQHGATSSDGLLAYSSTFTTYTDSDKVQITGTASNGSTSAPVKDIWVDLKSILPIYYFGSSLLPTNQITGTLSPTDNLWTNYGYGYGGPDGTLPNTYVYRDNQETVQPLHFAPNMPSQTYNVTACMQQVSTGITTYRYSLDGTTYVPFTTPAGGATADYCQSLGALSLGANFYIGQGTTGTRQANYVGYNYIQIYPAWVGLGSNVYDLQWTDRNFGQVGIAVQVNSPTNNIVLNVDDLRIYLYKQASAQTLTTFSYAYDLTIYPHAGWLSSAGQFTGLHTQAAATFTRHYALSNAANPFWYAIP